MLSIHIVESRRPLEKKLRFILSDKSDFDMIYYLSKAVLAFASNIDVIFSWCDAASGVREHVHLIQRTSI